MIETILAFAVMAGTAMAFGVSVDLAAAVLAWLVLSGIACSMAAFAMWRQPLGVSTTAGRLGGLLVRWGFEAGDGQLLPAVGISWLVWAILGTALISAIRYRSDRQQLLVIVAWAFDALALMYVIGLVLSRAGSPTVRSLYPVASVLAVMLVVSAALWFGPQLRGSRHAALLVAGGPPVLVAIGYGLFVLFMVTVGRGSRWN